MSQVLVTEQHLMDTADAIRNKLGVQTTYKPREFPAAIDSISTGGIETENIVPEQSLNCSINLGQTYGAFIGQYSAFLQNENYYLVTLNNVEYIVRAFYAASGYLIVGDNRINQGSQYEYIMFPFAIVHEGNYFYLSVRMTGVYTLKIDKILSWN